MVVSRRNMAFGSSNIQCSAELKRVTVYNLAREKQHLVVCKGLPLLSNERLVLLIAEDLLVHPPLHYKSRYHEEYCFFEALNEAISFEYGLLNLFPLQSLLRQHAANKYNLAAHLQTVS